MPVIASPMTRITFLRNATRSRFTQGTQIAWTRQVPNADVQQPSKLKRISMDPGHTGTNGYFYPWKWKLRSLAKSFCINLLRPETYNLILGFHREQLFVDACSRGIQDFFCLMLMCKSPPCSKGISMDPDIALKHRYQWILLPMEMETMVVDNKFLFWFINTWNL